MHALRVEPVRRLVEDEQCRVAEQRGGKRQPLPHAHRVASRRGDARSCGEPDQSSTVVHPAVGDAGRRARTRSALRPDAVRGGTRRGRPGRRPSGAGRSSSAYGVPSTVAGPAVGRARPSSMRMVVDLPAPFAPTKPVTRPAASVKVRSVDGGDRAVALGQPVELDGGHAALLRLNAAAACRGCHDVRKPGAPLSSAPRTHLQLPPATSPYSGRCTPRANRAPGTTSPHSYATTTSCARSRWHRAW